MQNLNVGCGDHPEPGFLNLDRVAGHGADVVFDLERCHGPFGVGERLPLEAASFDCILASHVLEHITGLIDVMREFHRILKPGGYLVAVTPYLSSDDAWEDPTHVRAFSENSWRYFDRRLYERPGHAGAYPSPIDYCFDVVNVGLVPMADLQLQGDPRLIGSQAAITAEFNVKKRFMRNVVKEMIAVLQKVEG